MPHDVTMPQLGMAQDAGRIVAWLKRPGERVARGDPLFEVETDKATMEVEAQAAGFLSDVAAAEGDDVPVGRVIARISDTADAAPAEAKAAPAKPAAGSASAAGSLPEGRTVTMPQLGMAQDTGLLVTWHVAPGDEVAAGDVLFEVETDKATMEVPAEARGFVAALLAGEGEEVPVGEPVAILSAGKLTAPVRRTRAEAPALSPVPAPEAKPPAAEMAPPAAPPPPKVAAPAANGSRILASPKARRRALELGLDLGRLAEAGHPQPFHMRDLEVLKALPVPAAVTVGKQVAAVPPRRITADIASDGFAAFAAWAAEEEGHSDGAGLLAAFATAALRGAGSDGTICIAVERLGAARHYVNADRTLRQSAPDGAAASPDLVLRDLRQGRITSVALGPEDIPALTLTRSGSGLTVTLECSADRLSASAALALVEGIAGRLEEPLRHLL